MSCAHRPLRAIASALVLLALLALPSAAVEPGAPPGAAPAAKTAATSDSPGAESYFRDLELVTHRGRTVDLYEDLMAGKVVILSTFFASCEGVCPVLAGKLVHVQDWLGDRLGDEVVMLSITVDAEHDTPEVLAAYAERWNARPGWYFLTGEPARVDEALSRLGQWVEDKESHAPVFLLGNVPTGLWKKANGLSSPEALVQVVDSVLRDRG